MLLSVRGLTVGTRDGSAAPVIQDVSFDLGQGEVIGFIGESGSGKTILARALVKWLPHNLDYLHGEILFRGEDMLRGAGTVRRGRDLAYIGPNAAAALDPTIPIGHQLVEKMRCVLPGISVAEAREKVVSLLAATRIPSPQKRFHEYPSEFSGGMMQRVMIVDALTSEPALLVADNITQPLDVTIAQQILRILRRLGEDTGTSIVFVSSSLPTVRQIASEVYVLNQGRIVEHQPPDALIRQPRHEYTKRLLERSPRIWSMAAEKAASSPNEREKLLEIQNVSRSYRVRQRGAFNSFNTISAVHNVSFEVHAGENFGIVGESGCGKSTLSRLFARLEQPDTGQILFRNEAITGAGRADLLASRQSFQLVLQDPFGSLPPRMTIGRIIAEGLLIRDRSSMKETKQAVLQVMSEVGLNPNLYGDLPTRLSAGQRQRIGVARALILEPRLLILDETMSSLDPNEQQDLLALFRRLQAERDLTYIFISHDMALVRSACTRVAVMYLGEVVEIAETAVLFDDPQHPYTRALLSAVPTLEDQPYDSSRFLLDGEPPSPIDLPVGCSFRSRCPSAFDRCAREHPRLFSTRGDGAAACFLVDERRLQAAL